MAARKTLHAPPLAVAVPVEPATAAVEPRCGACRYFRPDSETRGTCHRFPPPNDYSPPRMPPTLAFLWCGEFAT